MKELSDYEYYKNDMGVLYCGDCLEILPLLPKVDMALTSPPYDNLRTYHNSNFKFKATACELYKTVSGIGVLVWIVKDQTANGGESCSSFEQALFFKKIGFKVHDTMIWLKPNFGARGSLTAYPDVFEYMFIFSKNNPITFNPIRDRANIKTIPYKGGGGRGGGIDPDVIRPTKMCYPAPNGIRFNVWNQPTVSSTPGGNGISRRHPAPFPEKLTSDHIFSWSNEGDVVLDPFFGSGTTAIAAERLNRKWIGIEISEKYCEIAKKRIEQERQQLRMF